MMGTKYAEIWPITPKLSQLPLPIWILIGLFVLYVSLAFVLYVILALWLLVLQFQLPASLFICVLFVLFCVSACFSSDPKQNQGRCLVDREVVQVPLPPSPASSNFIAGRPKAAVLFWFFGDLRYGVLLFIVILFIYKHRRR